MNSYTVRIELHSNLYPDFISLHNQMEKEGFSRLITSDTGVTYHLPRAEYDISTMKPTSEVLESAKRAMREAGKTGEILVTKSSGRMWSGLSEVK